MKTEIQKDILSRIGISLSTEQIEEVIESCDVLKRSLRVGWDTASMGSFVNALGRWLGVDGGWPMYGDTPGYRLTYMNSFKKAAEEKGIELSGDLWDEV